MANVGREEGGYPPLASPKLFCWLASRMMEVRLVAVLGSMQASGDADLAAWAPEGSLHRPELINRLFSHDLRGILKVVLIQRLIRGNAIEQLRESCGR
eukprot:1233475-Rhodomonas_salina.2